MIKELDLKRGKGPIIYCSENIEIMKIILKLK